MGTKPQHILVATDLSACSTAAMEAAKLHGATYGAKITLIHVFDPTPYVPPVAIPGPSDLLEAAAKEVRGTIENVLAKTRDKVFGDKAESVEIAVSRHHSAGEAIADYAKENGVDFICVGSHGRTGLSRMFLGSVAERVVRLAPCAVLVVRPDEK